jgi:hypothetical protein
MGNKIFLSMTEVIVDIHSGQQQPPPPVWESWRSAAALQPEQPQPQDADALFFRLL